MGSAGFVGDAGAVASGAVAVAVVASACCAS